MKSSSAKAKGGRFENHLVDVFKREIDAKAHRTYGSGSGLDKNDVRLPNMDIEVEAKNQKAIKLIDWWEQTQRQKTQSLSVLAIRNPRKAEFQETLVVLDLYDFIELLKGKTETAEVISNYDPKLKFKMKTLIDYAKDVFRELD